MYSLRFNPLLQLRKSNGIVNRINFVTTVRSKSTDKPAEYQLYYTDSRGVVEPCRIMFSLKGVPFTDHRLPFVWPIVLPPEIKDLCTFGQVPILKIGQDKAITQSQTIARYLARTFGLTGKDEWEATRCDELVDVARDLMNLWALLFITKDPGRKAELMKTNLEKTKNRYFKQFNEILKNNKKEAKSSPVYLVGDSLTWADIWVTHTVDNVQRSYNLELVQDFPELQQLLETVFTTPGIKEWMDKRPKTKF